MKLFKIFILALVVFTSCIKNGETLTPNNEVITSLPKLFEITTDGKEYKQFQFNYNADFTKLESFIVQLSPELDNTLNMTFTHDAKGAVTGATVDNYNYKFTYTDKNITKAVVSAEGNVIEEREIVYAANKISQIKIYEFEKGVKAKLPNTTIDLTYIGENLSKFVYTDEDLGTKKITIFEGKTYDTEVLSPTVGLGIYNQAVTIGLVDEFAFVPSLNFQCFMSKNNLKTATHTTGIFALLLVIALDKDLVIEKLTDVQLNEILEPFSIDVTSKLNSSNIFPINNLFSFKIDGKTVTANMNISYNEKTGVKK